MPQRESDSSRKCHHYSDTLLAVKVQEHVCSRSDKASCIVFRGTLPTQLFTDLSTYYLSRFSDLIKYANGDLFEYQVDTLFRLKQFLKRVAPWLGDVPDSQRRREA